MATKSGRPDIRMQNAGNLRPHFPVHFARREFAQQIAAGKIRVGRGQPPIAVNKAAEFVRRRDGPFADAGQMNPPPETGKLSDLACRIVEVLSVCRHQTRAAQNAVFICVPNSGVDADERPKLDSRGVRGFSVPPTMAMLRLRSVWPTDLSCPRFSTPSSSRNSLC